MIEKIEPLPRIPDALRLAALQRKIVPFIGAGVSQLGGYPGWDDFANAALQIFVQHGKLSHAQFDQIRSLSSRVKLSIALRLETKCELVIGFKDLLKSSGTDKEKIGDAVYESLSRLATTFVTTNYDDWLDRTPPASFQPGATPQASQATANPRRAFRKLKDITVENLDTPNAVFHIHGSVHEKDSMVLTTIDYLKRYASHRIDGAADVEKENPFLTFLQTLFKLKNVLFIGYGLNELEVLEYVVEKGILKRSEDKEEPQHYVLQGFFTHEVELARSLEGYFIQFGIGLLPYSRDGRDWNQLVEVVSHLAREIPPGSVSALPRRREMEELLP
jgi:SIR2-like protein